MENGNSLSDVENVLVRLRCRRCIHLLGTTVQVQNVETREVLQEIGAHASKCRPVQVAVVCDIAEAPNASVQNHPVRKAEELYVVILKPELSLTKRLTIYVTVAVNQLLGVIRHIRGYS